LCEYFQVVEEREKLALVNTELSKLTQNLSKSVEMEKKVQDLEQKLQLAYSKSDEQASKKIRCYEKHSVTLISSQQQLTTSSLLQAKDAVVSSRSREFSLDSAASQNKQHDRSQAPGTVSPTPTVQEVREPSGIMAFKFILGVALLSVVIGVFLGKKY
jgi:hypothetical protein